MGVKENQMYLLHELTDGILSGVDHFLHVSESRYKPPPLKTPMAFDATKSYYIINSATQQNLIAINTNLQLDTLNTFLEPARQSNEKLSRDRWIFVQSATSPGDYQIQNCVAAAKSVQLSTSDEKSVVFGPLSVKATNLWKLSPTDNPNHFRIVSKEKSDKTLQIVDGKPVIGASQQNNDVWVLESFNNVWAYHNMLALGGDGRMINWVESGWHAIPFAKDGSTPDKMINATYDATGKLWGITAAGKLKKWNPPAASPTGEQTQGNWEAFADATWKLFSITFNSAHVKYASNHKGKVGSYDETKKEWIPLSDATPMIQIAFNKSDVLHGVGTNGKVYKYDGSKWAEGAEQGTTGVISISFDPNIPELTYFVGKHHDLQIYDHFQKKSFSLGVIGNYNLRHVFFYPAGPFGSGSLELATYQPPCPFPQPTDQEEKEAYDNITGGLGLEKFRSQYTLNGNLPEMVLKDPPSSIQNKILYTKLRMQLITELKAVDAVRKLYDKLSSLFTDSTLSQNIDLASIENYFPVPDDTSFTGAITSIIISMSAGIIFSTVAVQAAPVIAASGAIFGLLYDNVFQATSTNPVREKFGDLFGKLNLGFTQYKILLHSKFIDYLNDWGKLQMVAKMNVDLDLPGATKLLDDAFTLAVLQNLMPSVYQVRRFGSNKLDGSGFQKDNYDGTVSSFSLAPDPSDALLKRLWELGTAKEDLYLNQFGWNFTIQPQFQLFSIELFINNCTVNELNWEAQIVKGTADSDGIKNKDLGPTIKTGTIPPLECLLFSAFSLEAVTTALVSFKMTITDKNGPSPVQILVVDIDNSGGFGVPLNADVTPGAPGFVDPPTFSVESHNILSVKTAKFNVWEFPPTTIV